MNRSPFSLTNANDPPAAITLSKPNVLAQLKGVELSPIQVTDEDLAASYIFHHAEPSL